MNYLLETCVLSEFTKRSPDTKVVRWAAEVDEDNLMLSVITVGEVKRGIEKLPDSRRKQELGRWLNDKLIERFGKRILTLDSPVMLLWGSLTADLEKTGRVLPVFDSLIAATALYHNLIIVTRNVSDYAGIDVSLANPWEEG